MLIACSESKDRPGSSTGASSVAGCEQPTPALNMQALGVLCREHFPRGAEALGTCSMPSCIFKIPWLQYTCYAMQCHPAYTIFTGLDQYAVTQDMTLPDSSLSGVSLSLLKFGDCTATLLHIAAGAITKYRFKYYVVKTETDFTLHTPGGKSPLPSTRWTCEAHKCAASRESALIRRNYAASTYKTRLHHASGSSRPACTVAAKTYPRYQ